jgi:hypothetical protein
MADKHMSKLVWGQRVQICDETHASFGRIGSYEGAISAELGVLRVRFPGCVITAEAHQLLPREHLVCTYRRLKKEGRRPPIYRNVMPAACLTKDYGKTEAELAFDAWLDNPDDEAALRTALFIPRPRSPRRLTKATGSAS